MNGPGEPGSQAKRGARRCSNGAFIWEGVGENGRRARPRPRGGVSIRYCVMVYNHKDCRRPPGQLSEAVWPAGRASSNRPSRATRI